MIKKLEKKVDKRKKMWYTIKAVARGTARTSIRSLKIEQQNFERNMQIKSVCRRNLVKENTLSITRKSKRS